MVMVLRVPEGAANEVEPIKVSDVSKFVHGQSRLHKERWAMPPQPGWSVEGRGEKPIEIRPCEEALPLKSVGEYVEISTVAVPAERLTCPASLEETKARIRSAKVTKSEGGRTAISINDGLSIALEGVACQGRERCWMLRLQSRSMRAGGLESGREVH